MVVQGKTHGDLTFVYRPEVVVKAVYLVGSFNQWNPTEKQMVKVKDVFLKKNLLGQKVTLEGKIVSQCQSNGCWFFLQDDTGQLYIDMATNKFSLPSMPNKQVAASGTVARSQNNLVLIATGVEVK